jgi:hypothetical protein
MVVAEAHGSIPSVARTASPERMRRQTQCSIAFSRSKLETVKEYIFGRTNG